MVSRTKSPWPFKRTFYVTTTTATLTKTSLRERLIKAAINATYGVRRALLQLLDDDYSIAGDEPVLEVPQSGNCWIVSGRHGRTLVSRTLPIWDVDAVNAEEADETLESRFRSILEKAAPNELFRIYRTRGGIRVICTSRVIDDVGMKPDLKWFYDLAVEMNADQTYVGLCSRQKTFRARLDPKKSRQGVSCPDNARACRLIGTDIGNGTATASLMAQVNFHDRATMALFQHGRELF